MRTETAPEQDLVNHCECAGPCVRAGAGRVLQLLRVQENGWVGGVVSCEVASGLSFVLLGSLPRGALRRACQGDGLVTA